MTTAALKTQPDPEKKLDPSRLLPELQPYLETQLAKIKDDNGLGRLNLSKEQKTTICRVYERTGSISKAASRVGVSPTVIYYRLANDPDFYDAFSLTKLSIGDNLQATSVQMARKDHGVTDRMCQLKRFFPTVYRENQYPVAVGISLNLSP